MKVPEGKESNDLMEIMKKFIQGSEGESYIGGLHSSVGGGVGR